MSGRDEQPIYSFRCPICKEMGILTTEWTLFVGEGDSGNWGDYSITKKDFIGRGYLDRHKDSKITRICCNTRALLYKNRHVFFPFESIFKRIMNCIGFKDGVVR